MKERILKRHLNLFYHKFKIILNLEKFWHQNNMRIYKYRKNKYKKDNNKK